MDGGCERQLTRSDGVVHHDTADLRLTRWGAQVLFRDDEGWTVVLADPAGGPPSSPTEIRFADPAGPVPADAAALLSSLTRGAPLVPVVAADTVPSGPERREVGPADIEIPDLVSEPTVREVVRHALAGPARSLLLVLPAVRLDEDAEDVHTARVAIRRIRSRLKTFRPLVEPRWASRLSGELRTLGQALGAVRDLDVLTDILVRGPFGGAGMTELLAAVETERHAARAGLIAMLDDAASHVLFDRLVDAANDPALAPQADDPAGPVVPGLVGPSWRVLRRAVGRLPEAPPDAALHGIRIRAKRCRYAAEAVRPVVGRDARRLVKRLAAVQDALGDLNDSVVVTARLEGMSPLLTHRGAFAAGAASGLLVEQASHRRSAWRTAWRAAEKVGGWIE